MHIIAARPGPHRIKPSPSPPPHPSKLTFLKTRTPPARVGTPADLTAPGSRPAVHSALTYRASLPGPGECARFELGKVRGTSLQSAQAWGRPLMSVTRVTCPRPTFPGAVGLRAATRTRATFNGLGRAVISAWHPACPRWATRLPQSARSVARAGNPSSSSLRYVRLDISVGAVCSNGLRAPVHAVADHYVFLW